MRPRSDPSQPSRRCRHRCHIGDAAVAGGDGGASGDVRVVGLGLLIGVEGGLLGGEESLFLGLEVLWQVVEERLHGAVHRDVVQDDEDKEDDLQDQRSNSNLVGTGGHGKQTDQADHQQVATNGEMLQTTGVTSTLGVDVGIRHVQEVVPVGEVEEV